MAYKAKVTLDSTTYPTDMVVKCIISLAQSVDFQTGKPSSQVMAGEIRLSIKAHENDSHKLAELMATEDQYFSGKIEFIDPGKGDKTIRKVEFKDAMVVGYQASFETDKELVESVTITVRETKIDDAKVEKKWQ